MPDYRIRTADSGDIEVLLDLRELMLREMGSTDEAKLASLKVKGFAWLAEAFADGRAWGWIAESEGTLLGGASMSLVRTQPQLNAQEGRIAQIYGLYVYPAYRGRRIATGIVREAVDAARAAGCELATLHAAPRARPIYERLGFEPTSEMRLFLRDLR